MLRRGSVSVLFSWGRALIVGGLAVVTTACPPSSGGGSDTDGASSGDGGASSGAETSGEGSSSGGVGTSGEETAGGNASSSSGGATGGGGEGSLCDAYCARRAECGEDPTWCPKSCARNVTSYGWIGEGCLDVFRSYTICIQSHTCEEIAGDPSLCEELLDQVFFTDVCVTPGCAATCAKALECSTPEEDPSYCGVDCSFGIAEAAELGEGCADAYEAAQLCVGGVTCEEFTGDVPCADAFAAADAVCGA